MPHAIHACVISKTPHASPPQKMARKALGDVEVDGTRLASVSFLATSLYRRGKHKIVSGPRFPIDYLRLFAKSAAKIIRSPSVTAPRAGVMSPSTSRRSTCGQSLLSARLGSVRGQEFLSALPSHAFRLNNDGRQMTLSAAGG